MVSWMGSCQYSMTGNRFSLRLVCGTRLIARRIIAIGGEGSSSLNG